MTLRCWLIFYFCFLNCLNANEDSPLFVSLGGWCEAGIQLKEQHLRSSAFPFDWMLTLNHDKFPEILDEDFLHFLDENYIFQNPEYRDFLENSYYECEFRHDPPAKAGSDVTSHLQEVKEKYERRIERFRSLREYSGKVIFMRVAYDSPLGGPYYWWNENQEVITTEQAQKLKQALDRFFPKLNFTLVIINYTEGDMVEIDHTAIVEFKIRKHNRPTDYREIFSRLIRQ